jgi:hypothetical protein
VRGGAREGTEDVTDQKALKRRVRARMSKTGERYTAARRNLLAKTPEPEPADDTPSGNFRGDREMSADILPARTGRSWPEWYELLNDWGAIDRPHPEIARWLVEEHGVNGWWAQELTVRYEVASGRRKPGQRTDGYSVTASKTVNVPAQVVFDAFVDEATRDRWLAVPGLRLRKPNPYRGARFDWPTGTERLIVLFDAKGESKTTVSIEHTRLADQAAVEREKPLWRERLAELKRALEA